MRTLPIICLMTLLLPSIPHNLFGQAVALDDTQKLATPLDVQKINLLPKELLPPANPKQHMLVRSAMQMTMKGFANHSSAVAFSPRGNYVVKTVPSEEPQMLRMWKCANGAEVIPKAPECDYFSVPACWSPNETRMACIDGDWLRIWDLRETPPSLLQSVILPIPTDSESKVWNSIQWGAEDAITLSRIVWGTRLRTHQRFRQHNGIFSVAGLQIVPPREFAGTRTFYSDAAVSPDGALISELASADGIKPTIRVFNSSTGKEVTSIDLPESQTLSPIHFPNNSTITAHRFIPSPNRRTTMEFVGDGKVLLISTDNAYAPSKKILRAIATTAAGKSVDLVTLDETIAGDSSYSPLSVSPDGTVVGGILVRQSNTSKGRKVERHLVVHNLRDGTERLKVSSADPAQGKGSESQYQLSPAETVAFSSAMSFAPASDKMLFCEARSISAKHGKDQPSIAWSIGAWTLPDGRRSVEIAGALPGEDPQVAFSPNGEVVLLCARQQSQFVTWALEIPRLAALRGACDEGDRLWNEGRHRDAYLNYRGVISDEMSAIVCPDLLRLWSRCIDVYAENGDEANCYAVMQHLQRSGLIPSPETPVGRKVHELFLTEQAKARQESDSKAKKAEEKRVADVRAKNRNLRIVAADVSKQDVIQKMLAVGRNGVAFDDFSFDDVFGPPDGDIQWVGVGRVYLYRCRDGVIQLKVIRSGSMVFIQDISHF
jgi:hypothetical protein